MEKFIPESLRGNLSPVYCPVCRDSLYFSNSNNINCLNGHSYELTPSGYIDLHSRTGTDPYSSGHQFPALLERELLRLLYAEYAVNDILMLLDTGTAGQELFSNILLCMHWDQYRHQAIGLLTDSEQLPLPGSSVHVVLNTLTNCSFEECFRILKPGGLLLRTIGLQEIQYTPEQAGCIDGFSYEGEIRITGKYAILSYRKGW